MKIVIALLLVLTIFLGCSEDPILSYDEGADDIYGSSIVEIPGLTLSKITPGKETYTFKLSITGNNMKPLDFKWQLDESGASFKIDRIPAGHSRLFKGVLYGTDGSKYEGSATADIKGGKVAHVRLVLRRTGSAKVEVIIDEGIVEGEVFAGCWKLSGNVNDIDLSKYTFDIPKYKGKNFYGYIKEGDKNVGKFSGTDISGRIDAYISLHKYNLEAKFQCSVAPGAKEFKGVIVPADGSEESSVVGFKIECHPYGMFSGCWKLRGIINDINMSGFTMEVKQYKGDHFYGYINDLGGKMVGKFEGEEVNGEFTTRGIHLTSPDNVSFHLKGDIAPSMKVFRSRVYSMDGSTTIGALNGSSIECKKKVPPPSPQSGLLTGCWELEGVVVDIPMSKFTLEIPKYLVSFGGYIKEGDKKVGKFRGTENKGKIIADFYLFSPYNIDAQFTGGISPKGDYFKGVMVTSDESSSRPYSIEGHEISCSVDPSPAECIKETLGGIGSTSCKETDTWIKYAFSVCQEKGKKLTKHVFISQCDKNDPNFYEGICFECCE